MKIALQIFVDLWPILWLITLLRIFLRISIFHPFVIHMATSHENPFPCIPVYPPVYPASLRNKPEMLLHFLILFSMTWPHGMEITMHIFVDLWRILWLITLLRIFLRISIFHAFFNHMATWYENQSPCISLYPPVSPCIH